jgi:hypothetical protein
MPVLLTVFIAVIVPTTVAAALAGMGRVLSSLRASRDLGACNSILAIGLAYSAGHAAVAMPAFPPLDVTDRIIWIAGVATAATVAEVIWPLPLPVRLAARTALLTLTLVLILGPVRSTSELSETKGWLAATTALGTLAWINLWALEARDRGPRAWRSVIISASGASLVLLLSGSAILGLLGVVLSTALQAARLAGRDQTALGLGVPSAVLTALVIEGYIYASLSAYNALLLAAAPAGAWIGSSSAKGGPESPPVSLLSTIAVLVPVSLAVGAAAFSSGRME